VHAEARGGSGALAGRGPRTDYSVISESFYHETKIFPMQDEIVLDRFGARSASFPG